MVDLRAFYDTIEGHIRGLLSLGITQESYGALLIPIIWGKLPAEARRNLAREQNNSNWSIDQLQETLLREIQILEQGAATTCPLDTPSMITASLHAGSRSADHHRNYRSDKGTSRPIKKITCVYCKGIHTTNSCNVVVNTEKRLEHIKREGLCFNCLGKHRVSQCTSHARCKKCNNKHHTSICNAVSTKPQQSMEDSSSKYTEAKSNQTPKETIPVAATIALSDSQHPCYATLITLSA